MDSSPDSSATSLLIVTHIFTCHNILCSVRCCHSAHYSRIRPSSIICSAAVVFFKGPAKLRDSNSNRTFRFEFDSKVTCWFQNLNQPHMRCAVIPQTMLTHCSTKTSTSAPFVVEIYVYNSTLRVAVLLYLEHKHNSHMTIGIEHVNDYPLIRFEIRIQIIAPYSIRDLIRTEISDSQVPSIFVWYSALLSLMLVSLLQCVYF